MEVIRLDPIEGNLLSAVFEENDDYENEFEDLFNRWDNVEYLRDFFKTHTADLQSGFFGYITIQQAVDRTIEDANQLENKLIDLCDDKENSLLKLFKPLGTRDDVKFRLQQNKAKGSRYKSWLRVYAVRLDNIFIISGGAIKLTRTMDEREHLVMELKKLSALVNYLHKIGVETDEDYYYLDNEE